VTERETPEKSGTPGNAGADDVSAFMPSIATKIALGGYCRSAAAVVRERCNWYDQPIGILSGMRAGFLQASE
jgi:hypothetical protein